MTHGDEIRSEAGCDIDRMLFDAADVITVYIQTPQKEEGNDER